MPSRKTKKRSSGKSSRQLENIRDLLLKGELDDLIDEYEDNPIEFLEQVGRTFPPKLAQALLDIYFGLVTHALLLACRGGGKSQLLSCLASILYLFRQFDVLMLGGSAAQSKNDYNYTSEILTDNPTVESFSEDVLATVARSKHGNWLACVAASTKAVRGPHAGDPHKEMGYERHGGALLIDEECEAKEQIVRASFFTVNTAAPAIVARASTFHQAIGTFADAIDHAEETGYTIYQWDCFDIAEPCADRCEDCFIEFAGELHPEWPEFLKKNPAFKPYCQGKAKTASDGKGWMKIADIKHFFVSTSRDDFEVEMLGWRPSASGLVLDPNDIERCIVPDTEFLPGMPGCIAIDWGFADTTTVGAVQEQKDHVKVVLDAVDYHLTPDAVIYQKCVGLRTEYGFRDVYADSSHPFQNENLASNFGFNVHPVKFQTEKDLGVGVLKHWTENGLFKIPERFRTAISQLKNWRRKDGKIVKKDDHYPDMFLCAGIRWSVIKIVPIEGQGTGEMRESVAVGDRF